MCSTEGIVSDCTVGSLLQHVHTRKDHSGFCVQLASACSNLHLVARNNNTHEVEVKLHLNQSSCTQPAVIYPYNSNMTSRRVQQSNLRISTPKQTNLDLCYEDEEVQIPSTNHHHTNHSEFDSHTLPRHRQLALNPLTTSTMSLPDAALSSSPTKVSVPVPGRLGTPLHNSMEIGEKPLLWRLVSQSVASLGSRTRRHTPQPTTAHQLQGLEAHPEDLSEPRLCFVLSEDMDWTMCSAFTVIRVPNYLTAFHDLVHSDYLTKEEQAQLQSRLVFVQQEVSEHSQVMRRLSLHDAPYPTGSLTGIAASGLIPDVEVYHPLCSYTNWRLFIVESHGKTSAPRQGSACEAVIMRPYHNKPRASVPDTSKLGIVRSLLPDFRRTLHVSQIMEAYTTPSLRHLVLDVDVRMHLNNRTLSRHLFVFSDLLLIAKVKSPELYHLKSHHDVCMLWVALVPEDVSKRSLYLGWPMERLETWTVEFTDEAKQTQCYNLLTQVINKRRMVFENISLQTVWADYTDPTYPAPKIIAFSVKCNQTVNDVKDKVPECKDDIEVRLKVNSSDRNSLPLAGYENIFALLLHFVTPKMSMSDLRGRGDPVASLPEKFKLLLALQSSQSKPTGDSRLLFELYSKKGVSVGENVSLSTSTSNLLMAMASNFFSGSSSSMNHLRNSKDTSTSTSGGQYNQQVNTKKQKTQSNLNTSATKSKKRQGGKSGTPVRRSASMDKGKLLLDRELKFVWPTGTVPDSVMSMCARLYEVRRESQAEHIFRLSACRQEDKVLLERLDASNDRICLHQIHAKSIASALKQFLRRLPEGLLENRRDYTKALIPEKDDGEMKLCKARCIIQRLEVANREMFSVLLTLLCHVAESSSYNKMDAFALSKIMGPSFGFDESLMGQTQTKQAVCSTVEFFISHVRDLLATPSTVLVGDSWDEEHDTKMDLILAQFDKFCEESEEGVSCQEHNHNVPDTSGEQSEVNTDQRKKTGHFLSPNGTLSARRQKHTEMAKIFASCEDFLRSENKSATADASKDSGVNSLGLLSNDEDTTTTTCPQMSTLSSSTVAKPQKSSGSGSSRERIPFDSNSWSRMNRDVDEEFSDRFHAPSRSRVGDSVDGPMFAGKADSSSNRRSQLPSYQESIANNRLGGISIPRFKEDEVELRHVPQPHKGIPRVKTMAEGVPSFYRPPTSHISSLLQTAPAAYPTSFPTAVPTATVERAKSQYDSLPGKLLLQNSSRGATDSAGVVHSHSEGPPVSTAGTSVSESPQGRNVSGQVSTVQAAHLGSSTLFTAAPAATTAPAAHRPVVSTTSHNPTRQVIRRTEKSTVPNQNRWSLYPQAVMDNPEHAVALPVPHSPTLKTFHSVSDLRAKFESGVAPPPPPPPPSQVFPVNKVTKMEFHLPPTRTPSSPATHFQHDKARVLNPQRHIATSSRVFTSPSSSHITKSTGASVHLNRRRGGSVVLGEDTAMVMEEEDNKEHLRKSSTPADDNSRETAV